jgi:hypothetical protein
MTREEHIVLSRQLVNLVNNRRYQVGVEPLREAHIMRAVRYILGPEPKMAFPFHRSDAWVWDCPIPYSLTSKALSIFAAPQG